MTLFPPASYTAGHSAGKGGREESVEAQLERAHATLLALARGGNYRAVLQGIGIWAEMRIRSRGYACHRFSLPGLPDLLLVSWPPRGADDELAAYWRDEFEREMQEFPRSRRDH